MLGKKRKKKRYLPLNQQVYDIHYSVPWDEAILLTSTACKKGGGKEIRPHPYRMLARPGLFISKQSERGGQKQKPIKQKGKVFSS